MSITGLIGQGDEGMGKVWILSYVKRGFIQEPEIFYDVSTAQKRKQVLMDDFNSDYDELAIFEKQLPRRLIKE